MKNDVRSRILLIVSEHCKSKREFAHLIQMEQTTVNNQLLGKRSISFDLIQSILSSFPFISAEWLLRGEGQMRIENTPSSSAAEIPLFRTEAAAGFGSMDFAVEEKDIEAVYCIKELEGASFMLHVRGDSMFPTYSNGDLVAVKRIGATSAIQWGRPHLISTSTHGLLLKRIYDSGHAIIAMSDNRAYPPLCIEKEEIFGMALVVGSIRFEDY
ncbi:MAG: hypothetical protein LUF85_04645 [Bacteroides sp.]|nr:hypothetical protein [Bacteroides sp.]